MSEAVLALEGLKKNYGKNQVLKGVDMHVNRGDIYGLIGKNGAGKTTLFKAVLGLSNYDGGKMSILGAKNARENFQNRRKIGFFVGPSFYGYMNARQNLHYFRRLKGVKDKNEVDRVLEIVGLKDEKKPFKNFSLGMTQRLGIGNAILGNPDILILDEPTNGLDPQGIADVRHMVQRFRDEFGMTVIVSSHILGELEHTADRFGIVNGGVVVREITQEDLKEKQASVEIAVDDLPKAKEILTANNIRIIREIEEKSTLEDYYFRLVGGSKE